jgi:hypothetical protein
MISTQRYYAETPGGAFLRYGTIPWGGLVCQWTVRYRTPPVRRCPLGILHGWAVWPPVQVARSGSRSATEGRRSWGGVKSLFGGSKSAGRSVMRTLQPRHTDNGRAEPLMSRRRPCLVAARAQGLAGTGETVCARLASGRARSYKPMVKSAGVQRESDGVVVPVIGVQHNAPGGKGPDFDHVGSELAITLGP